MSETIETPRGIKRIDFNENKFMANGKEYFIETHLSVGRFCEYQILQAELAQGMTVKKYMEKTAVLYQLINQQRFADAAVTLRQMMDGMLTLEAKEPVVLKLCTLFINTADEDRTTWGNDLVVNKMADWKAEGIAADDFFQVAFTTVPGYIDAYNKLTQSITPLEELINVVNAPNA